MTAIKSCWWAGSGGGRGDFLFRKLENCCGVLFFSGTWVERGSIRQ